MVLRECDEETDRASELLVPTRLGGWISIGLDAGCRRGEGETAGRLFASVCAFKVCPGEGLVALECLPGGAAVGLKGGERRLRSSEAEANESSEELPSCVRISGGGRLTGSTVDVSGCVFALPLPFALSANSSWNMDVIPERTGFGLRMGRSSLGLITTGCGFFP